MRAWFGWKAGVYLVAGAVAVGVIKVKVDERLNSPAVPPLRPLAVEVYEATPGDIDITRTYNASISDGDRVVVTSRVPSTIVAVRVQEGVKVAAADVIAELDRVSIKAELDRASDAVRQVNADVLFYRKQLEIDKRLYGEGAITEINLDDTKRKLAGLEAALSQQQNNLVIARQNLSYSTIQAPIEGVVQKVYAKAGEQVRLGQPLAEIVGAKNYKAVITLPESDMAQIRLGAKASLHYLNGGSWDGRVDYIYPALDARTHTGTVDVYLSTLAGGHIYPGSIVRAEVTVLHREHVLSVPAHAIQQRRGTWGVFVASKGVAAWREVKLGASTGQQTIIESGLEAGEQVIVTPYPTLESGSAIHVAGSAS